MRKRGVEKFHSTGVEAWGRSRSKGWRSGRFRWTCEFVESRSRGFSRPQALLAKNLQMDMRIFSPSHSPVALADALDRTLQRGVEVIHHAGVDDDGFAAAQAG